jgi:hypothetical protein
LHVLDLEAKTNSTSELSIQVSELTRRQAAASTKTKIAVTHVAVDGASGREKVHVVIDASVQVDPGLLFRVEEQRLAQLRRLRL